MDGPPDAKRPRIAGPPPPQWPNQPPPEGPRQILPPPPQTYSQHHPSYPRPESQQPYPHDRRASDHSQYDPQLQDTRRPSSGPPHAYAGHPPPGQSPYPGREPLVKRDPSDEPVPPQYRPAPDTGANPPMHHEGGPRPFPYDPTRQPGYSPYPQSPMPVAEYGTPGFGPPRDAYQSVSYPGARTAEQQVRKKAQRAAQACDNCRALKAKCDEGRPACTSCKEKGSECHYRDPPPKAQDKGQEAFMEAIQASFQAALLQMRQDVRQDMRNEMQDIRHDMRREMAAGLNKLTGRVDPLEMGNTTQNSQVVPKLEPSEYPTPHLPLNPPTVLPAKASISTAPEFNATPTNESVYSLTPSQQVVLDSSGQEIEEDEEDGVEPAGPAKPSSIPVNHTTGAARLLLIAPIASICQNVMKDPRIKDQRYPMVIECARGLLRLYGRGEGNESVPGYDKEPLVDHGETPGDTSSEPGSSPPAAGEEWGQLGGLTPPPTGPQDMTRGPISTEGMPDFSRETVRDLADSYMKHMNSMHPILVPRNMDALIETFLSSIPESRAKTKPAPPVGFVGSGAFRNPDSPGQKRKRSPASIGVGDYADVPNFSDSKPGRPPRSITTCLVLLVMALGKICQHKGKIPDPSDPFGERHSDYAASPIVRNGHPISPVQSSPTMSTPYGLASPQDGTRSRRASLDISFHPRSKPRNIDFIPGLAYFALATDILGNQNGGNSLQHVHANILAGLYHGQLGRVIESYGYISNACKSLQVILRPKLDRFKKIKDEARMVQPRDNALVFAFWTCLQLESDIVAELPCPHSNILTFEDDMPGPNLSAAGDRDGFAAKIIESYSAQLFLRKHLNQLHNMFYQPAKDSPFTNVFAAKDTKHFPTIHATEESLHSIDVYAPNMTWDVDKGEPADNILEARLRAKYYGAQVITYRHFLIEIMKRNFKVAPGKMAPDSREQMDTTFVQEVEVPKITDDAKEPITDFVLDYARCGLKALIHSTKAFHGLGEGRLIVTNIWGTAHAQWGNMITLSAAYNDPILRPILLRLIDEPSLRALLEKTLAFLEFCSTPSSALHLDQKILRHMGIQLGLLHHPQGSNMTGSFSSSSTVEVLHSR